MTFEWLRVYPERLQGDMATRQLADAERWYLILAWQTARNAPTYGELRNANGAPIGAREFAQIAGIPARKAGVFLDRLSALGLAVPAEDGGLTFPKLRAWQGDDLTNAQRQKAFRARSRNAENNGDSNATVTPSGTVDVTRQTVDSRTASPKAETSMQPVAAIEEITEYTRTDPVGKLLSVISPHGDQHTETTIRGTIKRYGLCEADIHRAREATESATTPNRARYAVGVLKSIGTEKQVSA